MSTSRGQLPQERFTAIVQTALDVYVFPDVVTKNELTLSSLTMETKFDGDVKCAHRWLSEVTQQFSGRLQIPPRYNGTLADNPDYRVDFPEHTLWGRIVFPKPLKVEAVREGLRKFDDVLAGIEAGERHRFDISPVVEGTSAVQTIYLRSRIF